MYTPAAFPQQAKSRGRAGAWTKPLRPAMFSPAMSDLPPAQELAAALRQRKEIIADREFYARDPAGHLEQLKETSERITLLGQRLPPPVHPQLAHYLERCSFDKALAFLEEQTGA
jgi:hypothetical protein